MLCDDLHPYFPVLWFTETNRVLTQQPFLHISMQDNGWYSFEQGPVHFLMMDTEMSAFNQTAQLEFFKADLAAVDRSVTPWVWYMCVHGSVFIWLCVHIRVCV